MKFSILFRSLIVAAFLCLLTIPAAAQYPGPGMGSYTSIDYDEDTNTVSAYSQTDTDYELMGDYQATISLTVKNDYGIAVASGTATDDYGDGFAAVELSFTGAADTTYTATGIHRGIATLYDYDYDPPYNRIFYFDNWYFTPFEAQNVYEPWQYFFTSPGYTYYTRRTSHIYLGSTYLSVSTTRPTVTINVPQTAQDGNTVEFSVSVENGTPTAFLWSFEPTSGGNNPQVNFSNPTGMTTTAKAHWFAKPNSTCGASFDSRYTIKIKVTFQSGSPITKEAPFTVSIGTNWGGEVPSPTIEGYPTRSFDSNQNLWVVSGLGDLQRVPSPPIVRTPITSQFYDKAVAHENVHVEQYATGIFSDLYQINSLMTVLSPLTDSTENGLVQKIYYARLSWYSGQDKILYRRLLEAERQAWAVSDPMTPQYKYQGECQ